MQTFVMQHALCFFYGAGGGLGGVNLVPHHKMGEHRLRVIQNKVLGRIYGHGRDGKREWEKLRRENLLICCLKTRLHGLYRDAEYSKS